MLLKELSEHLGISIWWLKVRSKAGDIPGAKKIALPNNRGTGSSAWDIPASSIPSIRRLYNERMAKWAWRGKPKHQGYGKPVNRHDKAQMRI